MNNLKEERKNLKLTQIQLASAAGITLRAYQNYETDMREPPVRVAILLAKVLHTTVEELFPLSD